MQDAENYTICNYTDAVVPMIMRKIVSLLCGSALLAACGGEPKARSVAELLEDPIALEAAVVRCAQNRSETRYDAECVNARQAVSILEARDDRARAAAFEEESQRKREALRRTQEAAAEARRRATESEQRRREAEYVSQFGESLPAEAGDAGRLEMPVNGAGAGLPADDTPSDVSEAGTDPAPLAEEGEAAAEAEDSEPSDLEAIREELRRRNEETGD